MGLRMAPPWGVDNLFWFFIKVSFLSMVSLISGTESTPPPPPPYTP
jgi:hypothetical protein